jgi:rhamnogalacturonan endolyase
MLFKPLAFASVALLAKQAYAAFGITTSSSAYVIDAGSSNPLKFTVSRTSCDITSINYYGSELQYQSTGSHIGSGLGSATVTAETIGDYIKVTCSTDTLIHYYVVHSGDSIIHMATYTTAG